jgi:hypothetical protein
LTVIGKYKELAVDGGTGVGDTGVGGACGARGNACWPAGAALGSTAGDVGTGLSVVVCWLKVRTALKESVYLLSSNP